MKLTALLRNWKEASTLMMFAKNHPNSSPMSKSSCDYRLLMLERSSKMKFMPSGYVFPGGGISTSDYSRNWLDVFGQCGVKDVNNSLRLPPAQTEGERAAMFTIPRDWPISSDVAFRICAIRETFEEAGILIGRHSEDVRFGKSVAWDALDKRQLQAWRPLIQKDDHKFLEMCSELSVIPDIWSLYEWSCWLTPNNIDKTVDGGKRYDTAFYACCLPANIDAVHDQQEIVSSKWVIPSDVLSAFSAEKLLLFPPQIYELGRVVHWDSFSDLSRHIGERHRLGCQSWLPVKITFHDGVAYVLPGDDFYPDDPNIYEEKDAPVFDESLSANVAKTKNLHRFHVLGGDTIRFVIQLFCTVPQENGHMPPLKR